MSASMPKQRPSAKVRSMLPHTPLPPPELKLNPNNPIARIRRSNCDQPPSSSEAMPPASHVVHNISKPVSQTAPIQPEIPEPVPGALPIAQMAPARASYIPPGMFTRMPAGQDVQYCLPHHTTPYRPPHHTIPHGIRHGTPHGRPTRQNIPYGNRRPTSQTMDSRCNRLRSPSQRLPPLRSHVAHTTAEPASITGN